jgi:FixJ family two-component response regulator
MSHAATSTEPEPTVFVCDDDPDFRAALQRLIESAGLRVKPYPSAESFLEEYDPSHPGCVVLDMRMPGMTGLQLLEELNNRSTLLPVIVLTGYADVPTVIRALKAGAFEFLEKPFDEQALLERVRAALARDLEARGTQAERGRATQLIASLSPREREVMLLVVAGKANKEIADVLGLSPRTVEGHRGHVMDKLRAGSVAELVKLYYLATNRPGPV